MSLPNQIEEGNKEVFTRKSRIFKVVGLTLPASFTLFEQNDHCWAKSALPEGRFRELFDWAKSDDTFWKQEITAIVECDGFGLHGSPINGIVVEVMISDNQT